METSGFFGLKDARIGDEIVKKAPKSEKHAKLKQLGER